MGDIATTRKKISRVKVADRQAHSERKGITLDAALAELDTYIAEARLACPSSIPALMTLRFRALGFYVERVSISSDLDFAGAFARVRTCLAPLREMGVMDEARCLEIDALLGGE